MFLQLIYVYYVEFDVHTWNLQTVFHEDAMSCRCGQTSVVFSFFSMLIIILHIHISTRDSRFCVLILVCLQLCVKHSRWRI